MGPGVAGRVKDLVGKPPTLDDGRPGGFYLTRFRNLSEKHPKFIRGYGFEGSSGSAMFPRGADVHGFGASFKEEVRKNQGAYVGMGAFGEVLSRYENYVELDPVVKDKWGVPALRFHYKFGENEHRMAEDMKETAQEMFEAAGFEIMHVSDRVLTEGWSIHELGTARMGNDPKASVLNQFEQSHDVKNLFVVDGSAFVNASCQNPTWTIMSLCWRSCDYLADELKKGNL
jgi:choline dehydrogenase-like flavoprotein